ncbi:hypothetical protein JDV02_010200 [Purpureocillium takamizusanense]|uniref:FAD-binding FR-type domain-containing protein n=1 Tax=Purpureocillium takamizusanense TaxID=2060973 RepID=A0A9Q8QU08_9HYPO|nr:uncharacterized protein JDV02_010200 [Purpureocillium takamizusanense]UNI24457.1 hypothetical protein JDV02_010200 [Purpureocillium takamizusanense]
MAAATRPGHLERTAEEPRDERLHEVRLSRVEQVNERIRLFRLELQSGQAAKFMPGQWLDTYVPGIAKAGGFTITSVPSSGGAAGKAADAEPPPPPYFELAVQESPDNEVAAWLWRAPEEIVGALLRVRIGGSFVFPPLAAPTEASSSVRQHGQQQWNIGTVRNVFFVAGGVGINPLVSMLGALAETSQPPGGDRDAPHVYVLYATKMPASGNLSHVLFLERVARWFDEGRLRGLLRVYVTDGRGGARLPPEGACTLHGAQVEIRHGRIVEGQVRAMVGSQDPGTSLVYVCGPPTMTDQMVASLTSRAEGSPIIDPGLVLTEKWW